MAVGARIVEKLDYERSADWGNVESGIVGRVGNTCRRCRDSFPPKTWVHILVENSLFGDQIP